MPFGSASQERAKELGRNIAPEVVKIGLGQAASQIEAQTGFPVTILLAAGLSLRDIKKAADNNKLIPNPYFLLHGLGDGPSPVTMHHQRVRIAKRIGGAVYSGVGAGVQFGLTAASIGTGGVDVANLAKHGLAEASTIAHLTRLGILARRLRHSSYIEHLVLDMIKVKAAKAGVRGGRIAAAAIPNSIASNVVAITVTLGAAAMQTLFKELVNRVACEVHWRAYQELNFATRYGGGGGHGPACQMAQELMNHTISHGFVPTGKVVAFLREPAGYLVIKDKLGML